MGQSARKLLSNNIKRLRQQRKLKREELSLALGFDNSYISKLEKCNINITIDRLQSIADFFDVEPKNLFK